MRNQRCCDTTVTIHASQTCMDQVVMQLKAVAHPVRWRMLELMAMHDDGVCVCDLEEHFELSQPTISHHLRLMREAGVVLTDQRGTWVYYSVSPEMMHQIASAFVRLSAVKA